MKFDILLGLQWGDEGKGKIVDVLTKKYDIIARFQGGPNAGHTLKFDGKEYVLHTIPSGIFHSNCLNIIGNGVVIEPLIFINELKKLENQINDLDKKLLVSRKAHLILPTHRLLDAAYEKSKEAAKIGSTLKGIGPTYTDKVARCGLRMGDVEAIDFFNKYQLLRDSHLKIVQHLNFDYTHFKLDNLSFEDYEKEWLEAAEKLKALTLIDSEVILNKALDNGQTILAEGAQGALLDIDFGTYPFVTSSNTISSAACAGLGIAPNKTGQVFGVFKAYCTRVGSGPFPTELFDDTGEYLRQKGAEFGSTTGRPRRCGWLDLPALKHTCMLNGVTELIMMKTDVLSGMDKIKAAIAYDYKGKEIDYIPFDVLQQNLKPVYKEFDGWEDNITGIQDVAMLPKTLKEYVSFIEKYLNIPVTIVSIGPDRKQTLFQKSPLVK